MNDELPMTFTGWLSTKPILSPIKLAEFQYSEASREIIYSIDPISGCIVFDEDSLPSLINFSISVAELHKHLGFEAGGLKELFKLPKSPLSKQLLIMKSIQYNIILRDLILESIQIARRDELFEAAELNLWPVDIDQECALLRESDIPSLLNLMMAMVRCKEVVGDNYLITNYAAVEKIATMTVKEACYHLRKYFQVFDIPTWKRKPEVVDGDARHQIVAALDWDISFA